MSHLMAIVWWHWFALGLVLIALELAAAGGFYVIFFGIAAVVVGDPPARRPFRPDLDSAPAVLDPLDRLAALLPQPDAPLDEPRYEEQRRGRLAGR